MAMFYGQRGWTKTFREVGSGMCARCQLPRKFHLVLTYRYPHFNFVPLFVSDKHYHLVCTQCGNTTEFDSGKAEQALGKTPIPFHHRFGWLFYVPIGFFLLSIFSISQNLQDSATANILCLAGIVIPVLVIAAALINDRRRFKKTKAS